MKKRDYMKDWSRNHRDLFRTLAVAVGLTAAALPSRAFEVNEIQPPHWWAGMKDPSLQLQVFGKDVRPADVRIDYPGVKLDSVARLDGSPDWQFLYLSVSPEAKPGKFKIEWKEGKKKVSREYELRARRKQRGAQGFSAADVLYMVMPDRFSDGDPSNNNSASLRHPVGADRSNPNHRHGGDLRGLINHADYIDSLGVTTLWVAPVLENDMRGGSYHGYATTDYYRVDPRFGTNGEYAELIDTLHNRGIKTVMDMIFNHSGSGHPWFDNPPASNWFNYQGDYKQTNYRLSTVTDPYASDYDRSMTQDGWFVRDMPDLNQKNPHLMKYLIQNSIYVSYTQLRAHQTLMNLV
ncbi:MAG: cyclomaltodextrinase N-terminal domain-containing protein [Muribaculaceae bacterium]|nr:cyclomaltodextrinase N-terminal domain-containing protein [Muribaculaceae bacterium]